VMRCLAKAPADRPESMVELEVALCEAQIDAGLRTDWDDLPLPEIEPEARAKLALRMPHVRSPWGTRWRGRWWIAIATGVGAMMVAGLWLASPRVDAADHARVEELVAMTRAAAQRGVYVYPPPHESIETAYTSLITLEHLEGPAAEAAQEQAAALRRALAVELVALGDGYWEDIDARAYARDYYAQAVLFDPDDEHARQRPGELTELRVRAEHQDFTEPELEATAPLIELALVDEGARADKLTELALADRAGPSASRRTVIPQRRTPAAEQAAADDTEVAVRSPGAAADRGGAPLGDGTSWGDRMAVRRSLRKAERAVARGDLDGAQSHFEEVLGQDPDNGAALRGLADLSARQGKHQRALQYARRATRVDPHDGAALVLVGDANVKLHHMAAARRAYAKAADLGDRDAAQRLRDLD
jgi:tetratricopeptide (TPR) repeat protein